MEGITPEQIKQRDALAEEYAQDFVAPSAYPNIPDWLVQCLSKRDFAAGFDKGFELANAARDAEVKELVDALEWYANPFNWETKRLITHANGKSFALDQRMFFDHGDRAREALAKHRKGGKE